MDAPSLFTNPGSITDPGTLEQSSTDDQLTDFDDSLDTSREVLLSLNEHERWGVTEARPGGMVSSLE